MTERETLKGKRVAILVTDGFEQSELERPREALETAGAKTFVISPKKDPIQGWNHDEPGRKVDVDVALDAARASEFDALLLPGGVKNPDRLRTEPAAVRFVQAFLSEGKPTAAICHGPWMLVEADGVRGRKLTSWPSLRTDIENAGGEWVDAEVVVDRGLVSSRKPDDLPAFNRKLVEEIGEGFHPKGSDAFAGVRT